MKFLILSIFIFLLFGCSNTKEVYWCGDHACINKKEKETFFKESMIVEKKMLTDDNKSTKDEKDQILKQIRLKEKKSSKQKKELRKQARIKKKHEKNGLVEEEVFLQEKKECLDWNVKNRSLIKCIKPLIRMSDESSKKEIKTVLSSENTKTSFEFNELVEKINKQNMSKPYPNINNIPN